MNPMFKIKKKLFSVIVILILSLLFLSGCVDNDSGVIRVDINGGGDFKSIQEAIDHVPVGSKIVVSRGVYNELLIISKSVELIGDIKGRTFLVQSDVNSKFDSIIRVDVDNCVIKGFNILCDKNAVSGVNVIGINISSSNNTISYNFVNDSKKGIFLNRNTKNNTILGNIITNSSNGIDSFYSNSNMIIENNVSTSILYGVYVLNSDNNTISDNLIFDNGFGIRIKGSSENKVFDNYIYRNKQGLLCCCGATDNIMYNNIFKQNEFYNAKDDISNQWDNGFFGNYWDDYQDKYPVATHTSGIWNTPYVVTRNNKDRYPLVYQPNY